MLPSRNDVEDLARQAGEILRAGYIARPGFEQSIQINYKSLIDPVTEFDHRSEAFLIEQIQARFPGHSILSEESGLLEGKPSHQWLVDPLDGTVNYAHGIPLFAVSIAYAQGGVVRLGAVYAPMQDECFSAELGNGATLNGQPIRVSDVQDLDHSLLVTGFPYDIRTVEDNNLENYARFSLVSQGVRRLGSAAVDLCYVAAGRMEGFWEISLKPWDLAAGALIATEAGGIVTTPRGDREIMSPPFAILAAAPAVYPLMLKMFLDG